jgi:hypothetical protein
MFELAIFLLAILLMLFLGAVVFVYDPKKVANKLFFLWVIFASVWMATNFLENLSSLSLGVREVMLRIDLPVLWLAVASCFYSCWPSRDINLLF